MYKKKLKRLFDLLLVILGIFPLVLIAIPIMFAIIIDSRGGVFFKQKRLGTNGNVFEIYKFRTMVKNAESIGTGIYTDDNDPRITRIGNFLRKTSLDELPQVINVLKGEMSFVGPRPPVPYHPYKVSEYSSEQFKRFDVKPGITGMAQAYGRNSLTWDERIVYDVQYADNVTFLLDLKIIIKTAGTIVKKENIYRE